MDVHNDPAPAEPAPFQQVRYLEDHGPAGPGAGPTERVKHVALWPGAHVSFGGQHRLRYEYLSAAGLVSGEEESVLFSRNLLHARVRLSPAIAVFAQAGASFALGAPARDEPPGADLFDVHQLFLEATGALRGVRLTARAGRQEMALGSGRWVSTRDGTSVRQAFDIVRLSAAADRVSGETFFGALPRLQRGVLDDAPDPGQLFWGSHWTAAIVPKKALSLDVFYLGRARSEVTYREVSGRETRHTLGVRAFGSFPSGFEYIFHALLQVGKIGRADVLAWGFAGGLWQRLPGPLRDVRVGVRGDALSGDGAPGDGVVSTFHPLFPNQTFFSALPAIFPTNLYEVHPILRFERGTFNAEVGCVLFWRQSVVDAVYQPPGPPLVPADVSRSRYTGAQLSASVGLRATRNVAFNMEYSRIFAGPALADAGGRDVDFLATWTTFTY